ncbi:WXG100 family type VII secretion target [Catenuloplanes sp. NPDC051500]|uniref:WXG100 family type VII secretion target n=1 Tax=Catenuloplanes sp. NPDC051500 TaxID=3363959 RepID=UPI00378DDC1D
MSGPAGTAVELYRSMDSALSGVEEAVNSVCKVLAWPLIQLVDLVDGDPATLTARAADWDALAAEVRALANEHRAAREADQGNWNAESGRAYAQKMAETEQQLLEVADEFTGTADYLRGVAEALQTVHDVLVDLCVELINWLIVTFVTALLTMVITAGASWAVALTAGTVRTVATAGRFTMIIARLSTRMAKVAKVLQKVQQLLIKVADRLAKLARHLEKLKKMQTDKLLKGGKYAEKRVDAGKADKWFHTVTDPLRGSFKLGKSGTPFDMGTFDRIKALKSRGLLGGGTDILVNAIDHAPYNIPNSVLHGAAWGTTALVTGLSVPGADQVKDAVTDAADSGARWIDENVFGQEPVDQPAGR